MKPLHAAAVLASALLVAASAHAQKKPGSCGTDIPVSVQVLDLPGAASADPLADPDYSRYALRSDGDVYRNGVDKIDARIQISNCTRDLWMGLGLSRRRVRLHQDPQNDNIFTTVAGFNFDRLGWVPRTDNIHSEQDCVVQDNYGGCGFDADGAAYVRRSVTLNWELGSNDILKLQRAPEDIATYGTFPQLLTTSWVRVYHPAEGVYVLSPEPVDVPSPTPPEYQVCPSNGDECALSAHLAISRKTGQYFSKFVQLPFRIVVTTLQ